MTGVPWTIPEQRIAVAAARQHMPPSAIRLHLHKFSYPLRTKAAIGLALGKLGVITGTGGRLWTDAEDGALRAAYAAGGSLRAAGKALGRTPAAVRYRVEVLGLQGTHERPRGWAGQAWTPEEETQLHALYGTMRAAEIAERMGRSVHAVRYRAWHLKLDSGFLRPWSDDELRAIRIAHAHGLSVVDLADALGRDPSVVSRQAKRRMGLHFNRRINRAPRSRRATREPLTLASILAHGGGSVSRTVPAWSVLAGTPHRMARAA